MNRALIAFSILLSITITACSEKDEKIVEKSPAVVKILHACADGSKVVLAKDQPDAPLPHTNNVHCILDYVSSTEKNPENGSKADEERVNSLCDVMVRFSGTSYSEFKKGQSLEQVLTFISENGNPVAGAAMSKTARYVWENKGQNIEDVSKRVGNDCQKNPRDFYIFNDSELRQYRVIGGPPSRAQTAEAAATKILAEIRARSEKKPDNADLEFQVRQCMAEAAGKPDVVKDISLIEIQAACKTLLNAQ